MGALVTSLRVPATLTSFRPALNRRGRHADPESARGEGRLGRRVRWAGMTSTAGRRTRASSDDPVSSTAPSPFSQSFSS